MKCGGWVVVNEVKWNVKREKEPNLKKHLTEQEYFDDPLSKKTSSPPSDFASSVISAYWPCSPSPLVSSSVSVSSAVLLLLLGTLQEVANRQL